MCIRDGRIVRIFDEGAEQSSGGPAMDLGGMHVIPGLMDAHRHFFVSALLPLYGDASSWLSREDAIAAIREAVSARSLEIDNPCLANGAPAAFCIVDGDPFSDSGRVVRTWIDGVRACRRGERQSAMTKQGMSRLMQ
jgi:predicted amidohydrolase YtcJ